MNSGKHDSVRTARKAAAWARLSAEEQASRIEAVKAQRKKDAADRRRRRALDKRCIAAFNEALAAGKSTEEATATARALWPQQ